MLMTEMSREVYDLKHENRFVNISAMPLQIWFRSHDDSDIEVLRDGDVFLQRRSLVGSASSRRNRTLQPYALRGLFERISKHDEVEAFLRICGPFLVPAMPQEVTLGEFHEAQKFIRDVREQVPVLRYPGFLSPESVHRIETQPEVAFLTQKRFQIPQMVLSAGSALEVIGATLFVDRIQGKRVGKCDWMPCSRLYDLESEHERRFCCPEHRRMEARRVRRQSAAKVKKEALSAKA